MTEQRQVLLAIASAAVAEPRELTRWLALEHALVGDREARIGDELRTALCTALREQAIDPIQIPNLIFRAYITLPIVMQLVRWRRTGTLRDELAKADRRALADPALLELLGLVRVFGVELELAIQQLRSWLLAVACAEPDEATLLPLACALAIQCFDNDYVLYVSPEEAQQLAALRTSTSGAFAFAVLGCYLPLHELDKRPPGNNLLDALVRVQIEEPAREAALRAQLVPFGRSDDEISRAVRAQYEEHPYPRWTIEANISRVDRSALAILPALAEQPSPRILVAGCGTGKHPIGLALAYPNARIVAIDLSATSLAYAWRKAEGLGIANIEWRRGNLLDAAELGTFDAIECVGVLHHLRDPLDGWRRLATVLAPGGWFKVGLYSRLGRRAFRALRERIADEGLAADADTIRAYRWRVLHDQADPLHRAVAMWTDFYNLSECRDLLFHVQEHVFSVPELADAIAKLGFVLVDFVLDDRARELYRRAYPDDPDMRDLLRWAELEERNPDLFARMYQLWLRKPV